MFDKVLQEMIEETARLWFKEACVDPYTKRWLYFKPAKDGEYGSLSICPKDSLDCRDWQPVCLISPVLSQQQVMTRIYSVAATLPLLPAKGEHHAKIYKPVG